MGLSDEEEKINASPSIHVRFLLNRRAQEGGGPRWRFGSLFPVATQPMSTRGVGTHPLKETRGPSRHEKGPPAG